MAISPLDIATQGYLCNPLSVVVDGYLCTVEITPPEPPQEIPDNTRIITFGGGAMGYRSAGEYKNPDKFWKDEVSGETEETRIRKITITVEKGNKKHIESHYVDDPTIKVEDVKFEIIDEKPEIKLKVWFDK